MSDLNKINTKRKKRRIRVRAKLFGTTKRPRLSVFRSNKHISLQVINDETGKTLLSISDQRKKIPGTKTDRSVVTAKELSKSLKSNKIEKLVFDRSHYKYHGRIKAVAETLREAGIEL